MGKLLEAIIGSEAVGHFRISSTDAGCVANEHGIRNEAGDRCAAPPAMDLWIHPLASRPPAHRSAHLRRLHKSRNGLRNRLASRFLTPPSFGSCPRTGRQNAAQHEGHAEGHAAEQGQQDKQPAANGRAFHATQQPGEEKHKQERLADEDEGHGVAKRRRYHVGPSEKIVAENAVGTKETEEREQREAARFAGVKRREDHCFVVHDGIRDWPGVCSAQRRHGDASRLNAGRAAGGEFE